MMSFREGVRKCLEDMKSTLRALLSRVQFHSTILTDNVFDLDFQMACKKEHSNDLPCKNHPKWNTTDPKQSMLDIKEYFNSLRGRSGAPCSYIILKDIMPL